MECTVSAALFLIMAAGYWLCFWAGCLLGFNIAAFTSDCYFVRIDQLTQLIKMNKITVLLTTLLFFTLLLPELRAQADEPLAEQLTERFKTEPMNVGILVRTNGVYSFKDDGFNDGRRYGLSNARLRFRGTVDEGFTYDLQMEFNRQSSILDLNVGYIFSEKLHFIAGAQKPDIGLDLSMGPGNTALISRARLIGTMLNSREIGVSAKGVFGDLDYNIGMFNGYGLDRTNDNNFMYLGKVGYTIESVSSTTYLGANAVYNNSVLETVGNTGFVSLEDRWIYGGFIDYDSDSIFGAAEFLQTTFERVGQAGDETITGLYATAGFKLSERNEVLARWDHLSFDEAEERGSERIILGWNHYATSLVKFQVNLIADYNDDDTRYGLAGTFQFQF